MADRLQNAERIIITKAKNGYIIETHLFEPEQVTDFGLIVSFGIKHYVAHNIGDALALTKEKLDAKSDERNPRTS